jgi:hypothetical protein
MTTTNRVSGLRAPTSREASTAPGRIVHEQQQITSSAGTVPPFVGGRVRWLPAPAPQTVQQALVYPPARHTTGVDEFLYRRLKPAWTNPPPHQPTAHSRAIHSYLRPYKVKRPGSNGG